MSKYKTIVYGDKQEPIFVQGPYAVYDFPHLRRWYLVCGDREVAWKNHSSGNPDYSKWIAAWEKNARKQLDSLQVRINALLDEKDEILYLLTRGLTDD
jgi:hypothetical protein